MLRVTITGEEIITYLPKIVERAEDIRPLGPRVRSEVQETVSLNFREGGRPAKWEPRKQSEKKATLGDLLIGSGRMKSAALNPAMSAKPDRIELTANVGVAGVVQQEGFTGYVRRSRKGYFMRIPARPYFVIPETDSEVGKYLELVRDHILSW